MRKGYKHFTELERERLYELLAAGKTKDQIAESLNKDRSSIYRELKRNKSRLGYLPDKANQYYHSRRQGSPKLEEDIILQKRVIKLLKRKLSPRQIYLKCKREDGVSPVSAETIYQFIYSKKGKELGLSQYLRRKRKKRKPRKVKSGKRISIPNRIPIIQRPKEIALRESFGHWEGDLMIFSRQKVNLITLRERKSRAMLAIKNDDKVATTTAANIIKIFRGKNKNLFASCTLDNGGEFAQHETIAKKLNADTYFCDPYSSYQKGSVEQGNGVVRAELPRETDLGNMTQSEINKLMKEINNRPMELHEGASPSEIFRMMAEDQMGGFVALQI